MNPNIAAATHIRDQRLISKTKKSYLGKLNVLRTFLIQNGYEGTLLGRNGEILLHMGSVENQKDALTEFSVGLQPILFYRRQGDRQKL